jgi:hypothetical protein
VDRHVLCEVFRRVLSATCLRIVLLHVVRLPTKSRNYFYQLQQFNIPYYFSRPHRLPSGRLLVVVLYIFVQISCCFDVY